MRTVTRFSPALALLSFAPFAVPLVALGGCQSAPIDPPALADRAALSAREVVHQTGGGVAFTQSDDSSLQKVLTGMGHAGDGLSGMAAALPPGMMSAMGGTAMAQAAAGMPSLQTTEEQFDDTADDLKVWLRERILADTNLESQTSDEAVYLLRGEPTCLSLPRAGDPDPSAPTLNERCVDQLGRVQVRVVLRTDGDGVRLTIEVGPDKLELSAFIIHSDLLALESNLPRTQAAAKYIDQTLGTDSPMGGDELESLEGVARVSLQKLAERKVTFAISVPSAIHVATRSASGTLGPDVRVAASASTFALTADGVAQTATASVNLGAVDVLTNWNPQGSGAPNRDAHFAVGGLTGATTFTEGTETLTFKGLGIGATSLAVRGASIFDLDLNPSDMHRFDLVVTIDAAGEPHFALTPRFDLSLGFHLAAVTGDFARENQPSAALLNETYRIRLDNGGAAATIASVPASSTFAGGLSVGPGTLTLSSDKAAAPIVVPAGKCLTHVDNPPADAHPILGAFAVADCR